MKLTLPLPWNDLNPGKMQQQCKWKTIGCYFCVPGLTKHIARHLSTCFRDPFEALKPGLISNYLPTPPHMAEDTEGSPDCLGVALNGNPLLKRSFKQDINTAQSSEPLNSVRITVTKTSKNRKPRAKFMISGNRTIIS